MLPYLYSKPGLISGFLLALLIVIFQGCVKEDDFKGLKDVKIQTWNPTIAAPLGGATLTLKDIMKQVGELDFLKEDPDGSLRVYHRSTLLSETAGELITFDRQEIDTTVSVLFPVTLPVNDSLVLSYKFLQKFSNSFDDVVDSIRFYQGLLEIEVESMMDHNARLVISSPFISKNNVPFRAELDLKHTGSLPVVSTASVNLNGYSFIFDHAGGNNDLAFFIDIIVHGDGNPNPGPYPLKITISQDQLRYRALFGQIKTRSMALLKDVITLPLFENGLGGTFRINDPKIGIYIRNSFGIPISIAIDPLKGFSDVNPPFTVSLSGSGLPVPFMLNSPTVQQIGQKVNTNIVLNKLNSNIDDFLNLMPQKIEYGVEGIINPAGVTPGNFVLDTSAFEVEIEIEIPLEGYASGFTLQDTMELTFEEDLSMLDWILFRVNAESTFPFEAAIQVIFLDALFQPIDSLFTVSTVIIPGALPGPPPLYKSTTAAYRSFDIRADRQKLGKLNGKVRYMVLKGRIDTSGGGNKVVKIYTDNYLRMDMGIQGKASISPDDFK
jgi:hypothetical protein